MTVKDGIGFSSKTGAVYMVDGIATTDAGKFVAATPKVEDFSNSQWSNWGSNNLLPVDMAKHIEGCGVLNAALEAKSLIAGGRGFHPFLLTNVDKDGNEDLEWVDDTEIHDFIEENCLYDYVTDGNFDKNALGMRVGSVLFNGGRDKINRIRRIDAANVRLEKKDTFGNINSLFLCEDWANAPASYSATDKKIANIKMMRKGYELYDIANAAKSVKELAFADRRLRLSRGYYPLPLWYSALEWVKVARSIPALKNAMFTNQITVKYLITISDKYWESIYDDWDNEDTYDAKKKLGIIEAKYDEIDKWLSGNENQYKSISTGSYLGDDGKEYPYITIIAIDDKIKDGKLLPESSAANSEILFSIMMNPALIGAGQPGGPYSNNAGGSNIRESYLVQIMLSEPDRRDSLNMLNIIKRFNGWDKRLEVERTIYATSGTTANLNTSKKIKPRLVFKWINPVLTTLDTGKSTKTENL